MSSVLPLLAIVVAAAAVAVDASAAPALALLAAVLVHHLPVSTLSAFPQLVVSSLFSSLSPYRRS